MENTYDVGADLIINLPSDTIPPSSEELKIVESMFVDKKTDYIHNHFKDPMVVGLLYVILSLPVVDKVINNFAPLTLESEYILLCIKTIVLMITYWLIKNFYLSRQ